METKIVEDIKPCIQTIKNGGLVAFPTETVYGLGANALLEDSAKKIFEAKGRPSDNPLIVHVNSIEMAKSISYGWNENVENLVKIFWPGPLTIVMKKKECIPKSVSAGLDTVGIRMPNHTTALQLISKTGVPICAPSANKSGRPSPTMASHVYHDLQGIIPYIIDGGQTTVGIESTVVDCTKYPFKILRPGSVTKEQIQKNFEIEIDKNIYEKNVTNPSSPGMKYKHYCPNYQVILVNGDNDIKKIQELYKLHFKMGEKCVILSFTEDNWCDDFITYNIGSKYDLDNIAANLYKTLIELEGKVDIAFCRCFENQGVGMAISNRLLRAAGHKVINS